MEMRTKRLPFQCQICEVRYTKKESLDSHITEDHKGETIPKTKVKKLKVKNPKRSKKLKVKTENADYNEFDD